MYMRHVLVCWEMFSVVEKYGAIHTSELDRSETDLSPKRSECVTLKCELRSI